MGKRFVFSFEKNIRKFQWEMADEKDGGWYTADDGLSKEEILKVIKILYTEQRCKYLGLRFKKAYEATTPNWQEDFKKVGIKE
jgi:hypothetical protein